MTTAPHAILAADWKLTGGRRMLTAVGWLSLALAAGGVATAALGTPSAWWVAAASAAVALVIAALLPSPVPSDLLTDRRSHVDARAPLRPSS